MPIVRKLIAMILAEPVQLSAIGPKRHLVRRDDLVAIEGKADKADIA